MEKIIADEAEESERQKDILRVNLEARLASLLDDPIFCAQTTQRARTTYAFGHVDGLRAMPESWVKIEVAKLSDELANRQRKAKEAELQQSLAPLQTE